MKADYKTMPMDVLWIWPEIKHKPNFKNFVKDHGYYCKNRKQWRETNLTVKIIFNFFFFKISFKDIKYFAALHFSLHSWFVQVDRLIDAASAAKNIREAVVMEKMQFDVASDDWRKHILINWKLRKQIRLDYSIADWKPS